MNTSKQVNLMVGLLFLLVVSFTLYWLWEPIRAEDAGGKQTDKAAERGAKLFATFCRTCHGDQGLGRLERNDLPGLPLNLPDNRPEASLELEQKRALFRDTIRCGRVGTLMPPWSQDQGGALNEEQIRQLVVLITSSRGTTEAPDNPFGETTRAWQQALEFANHADESGKKLLRDVGAEDTIITLSDTKGLALGAIIRLDNELLEIKWIATTTTATGFVRGNDITVERGLRGTQPAPHSTGSPVYGPPIDPPSGPLNEQACGQFARGGAGAAPPPTSVSPDTQGTVNVEMGDNFFRQSPIQVAPGQQVTVNLVNNGKVIHNMRIAGPDNRYESGDDVVSNPDTMRAGAKGTLRFQIGQAGTFNFRCDFHPTEMVGTITVGAP